MDNGNGTATVGGIPTMTGTFGITITAQNSVSPNAMQTFTLTVDQAPAITSTNSATFVLDASASFTVTSSGFPTPVISESGTLPSGVMFVANPNGTGTLSGTPTMDGTFPIMFTAANGVGSPAMQSFTLTVSGPLVELAPASIDFGNAYIHSARKRNVSLKNAGNAPLTISDVSLSLGAGTSPGNFEIDNLCPATLGARKSCVIVVLFLANEVGSLSATLNVADNASPSPQQVSMSATVINPIASFNPARLSFRSVEIGHSATQTTTLTNTGTTTLDITSISITGADMGDFQTSACPSSLAPGANCVISVTFTPTATGTRTADLTLVDNAAINTRNVPLMGNGLN